MTDKKKEEQIYQYYQLRLERLFLNEGTMSTNHLEVELKNIHRFFRTLLEITEKEVKEDYCVLALKKKDSFSSSLIPKG